MTLIWGRTKDREDAAEKADGHESERDTEDCVVLVDLWPGPSRRQVEQKVGKVFDNHLYNTWHLQKSDGDQGRTQNPEETYASFACGRATPIRRLIRTPARP